MNWYRFIIILLAAAGAITVPAAYLCYRVVFAVPKGCTDDAHLLPKGEQYDKLRDKMLETVDAAAAIPFEDVFITTKDGLRLHGRYYETAPGAPVQILFHGYRSNALRDFSGGLQLALESGCNALLVDQRAHGASGGKCLSFGVLERRDCLEWIEYVNERFGRDVPVVPVGVSMGAATVLMASGLELPENVVGIIADCGYTSPRAIICKVASDMKLPARLVYPLVRLGARLFGGFDPDECSAEDALRSAKVPVLLIHGEDDRFVPCEMSRTNHAACRSEARLLTVPGAGHGLSYLIDYDGYRSAVLSFLRSVGVV